MRAPHDDQSGKRYLVLLCLKLRAASKIGTNYHKGMAGKTREMSYWSQLIGHSWLPEGVKWHEEDEACYRLLAN